MKRPIFAIRPEPGCSATVRVGGLLGLAIEGRPLFEIRPCEWDPPPPEEIDGLLLGSANAVRHAGPALELFRDKPTHAVGTATARAAEAAGLTVATVGKHGLQRLLDSLPPPLALLRLAGVDRVPLTRPLGVSLTARTVYKSVPLPLLDDLAARLRNGGIVLLHSANAARHFAAEIDRLGVEREAISLIVLGPRIAQAAGAKWRSVHAAPLPSEAALLALARDMCHEQSHG